MENMKICKNCKYYKNEYSFDGSDFGICYCVNQIRLNVDAYYLCENFGECFFIGMDKKSCS